MNNKSIILVLLSLINLWRPCFSQIQFSYGPELGLASTEGGRDDEGRWGYSKSSALVSPLIGLGGQVILVKHLQLTFGIQYEMIGTRDYIFTSPSDEYWENITFHKLCAPLTTGFTFKIGKIHPSVFVGIRPNFLLTGKYYKKTINYDRPIPIKEFEYNPVNHDQTKMPAQNYLTQYTFGIAGIIGQNLKIVLSYSLGNDIEFSQYIPADPAEPNVNMKSLWNHEFALSFTYLFKPEK